MKGSYQSDGARLSYRDSGAGLAVVFLHPTPLDQDYWRPLVDELGGVRAIVPDLRGHGESELGTNLPVGGFARVPDAPVLTMEQLAADILALIDHLGIADAVFAGCSIGGYVLMELWRRAPQRMRGLAIVCSKPQPDAEANLEKRAATIARARAGESSAFFDGMAQSLIGATARARRPEIVAEAAGTHDGNARGAGGRAGRAGDAAGFGSDGEHDSGSRAGDCGRRGSNHRRRRRWKPTKQRREDASFICFPMPGTLPPMSSRRRWRS